MMKKNIGTCGRGQTEREGNSSRGQLEGIK